MQYHLQESPKTTCFLSELKKNPTPKCEQIIEEWLAVVFVTVGLLLQRTSGQ